MATIIWSKIGSTKISKEYYDELLYEDNDVTIIKYYGQKSGRRDHLINSRAKFCGMNNKNERVYKGDILSVILLDKENGINTFKLIIQNKPNIITRTKNDMCSRFKLSTMDSFERTHGITIHNLIE